MENGFFGTDEHRRMQAKSDSLVPWSLDTPGACITGRVISSDDCGALGWDIIRKHLIEDEMFGFRFMSPVEMEEVRNELLDLGAKIQTWVGFHGQAEPVAQAIAPILSQKIPDGLHVKRLEGEDLVDMQAFLAAQGMTPISTASLGGTLFPAVALGVIDDNGQLMAVG